ncbi:MAG: amidohydrolase [Oceanospirillaceae bacterium]
MSQWIKVRKHLHQHPELSGAEQNTAAYVLTQLQGLNPDRIYQNLGGQGIAVCFDAAEPGPNVLFRAELDALPIEELNQFSHRSVNQGVSHKCGHDGHMATILALGEKIAANRPLKGTATLLFQPAEETGEGAIAVVADPQFKDFKPDYCFALHNLPGHPLGQVLIRAGSFNCASRGMSIALNGKTAHAAYPETGISPANVLAELIQTLPALAADLDFAELTMLTLIHCSMGEEAFGTSPGAGKLLATLRTESNEAMATLVEAVSHKAQACANQQGLELSISWHDVFNASVNDEQCAQQVASAALYCNNEVIWLDEPLRWSEDFGALSQTAKGAMFAFGAGQDTPQIHNPDYDFPDALVEQGKNIFYKIYQDLLR